MLVLPGPYPSRVKIPTFNQIMSMGLSHGQKSNAPHLWDSLKACYPMQEGGGLTAHDVAGGHHGTLTNGPTWGVGEKGRMLEFNPADSEYVALPDEFAPSAITGRTVSVWASSNALDSIDGIIGVSAAGAGWYLRVRGDAVGDYVWYTHGGVNDISSAYTMVAGVPIHIVVTWDGTTAVFYIDGRPTASGGIVRYHVGSTNAAIGAYDTTRRFWNGALNNCGIWDRPLALAEIQQLYADPWGYLSPRLMFYPVASVSSTTINIAALLRRRRKSIYRR